MPATHDAIEYCGVTINRLEFVSQAAIQIEAASVARGAPTRATAIHIAQNLFDYIGAAVDEWESCDKQQLEEIRKAVIG